jgi:hypothetical protein
MAYQDNRTGAGDWKATAKRLSARATGTTAHQRNRADPNMTDTPPDRLSVNPRNPNYDEAILSRGIGIRFNGVEKTNVEEYCVSEGWIRVAAGRALDRKGNPITLKLNGTVEPYFERPATAEADAGATAGTTDSQG